MKPQMAVLASLMEPPAVSPRRRLSCPASAAAGRIERGREHVRDLGDLRLGDHERRTRGNAIRLLLEEALHSRTAKK